MGGFGIEVRHGIGVQRNDGEDRIFRANFFHVVQSTKIPGVGIDEQPVATAVREVLEESGKRIDPTDMQGGIRSFKKSLSELRPGSVFAQKENFESRILHWSYVFLALVS